MTDKAIEKLPLYNFLNMILTGGLIIAFAVFCSPDYFMGLAENFNEVNVIFLSIAFLLFFVIAYELGYIVFRIGGVVIEPLLIMTKIVPFNKDYQRFSSLKKEYPDLEMLSREYAFARTQGTLFLIFTIAMPFYNNWQTCWRWMLLMGFCSLLFYATMQKHSKKITNIMAPLKPVDKKK